MEDKNKMYKITFSLKSGKYVTKVGVNKPLQTNELYVIDLPDGDAFAIRKSEVESYTVGRYDD